MTSRFLAPVYYVLISGHATISLAAVNKQRKCLLTEENVLKTSTYNILW